MHEFDSVFHTHAKLSLGKKLIVVLRREMCILMYIFNGSGLSSSIFKS